jgi:hypothetical protein
MTQTTKPQTRRARHSAITCPTCFRVAEWLARILDQSDFAAAAGWIINELNRVCPEAR